MNAVPVVKQSAIINPKEVLDAKHVKAYDEYPEIVTDVNHPECQIQQNGIDCRLAEVHVAAGSTDFYVVKEAQRRCDYHPVPMNNDDTYYFEPGKQYACDFFEEISIPAGAMAYLFMRSSLNRYSGVFLTGLYDAGFKGRIGGIFRPSVPTRIQHGFRMAQVVFFYADSFRNYDGQYQGQHRQV